MFIIAPDHSPFNPRNMVWFNRNYPGWWRMVATSPLLLIALALMTELPNSLIGIFIGLLTLTADGVGHFLFQTNLQDANY